RFALRLDRQVDPEVRAAFDRAPDGDWEYRKMSGADQRGRDPIVPPRRGDSHARQPDVTLLVEGFRRPRPERGPADLPHFETRAALGQNERHSAREDRPHRP